MLTCKACIDSRRLLRLRQLQTLYMVEAWAEYRLCVHALTDTAGVQHPIANARRDTFTGREGCLVSCHLVLTQHLSKGEAAVGMRWRITCRLGLKDK